MDPPAISIIYNPQHLRRNGGITGIIASISNLPKGNNPCEGIDLSDEDKKMAA
jgi:hypothetical protein